jgi:Tfp pilus assembly protein PilF
MGTRAQIPYVGVMTLRAIPALLALLLSASIAEAAPTKPVPAKSAPAKAAAAKATKAASAKPVVVEPPVTVESLLTQAKDAVTKGDTDLAVRLTQSAIVHDPARTSSYVALGDIYAAAGQPDYARSFYEAALGIEPGDAGAQKALSDLNRAHPETTARNNQ